MRDAMLNREQREQRATGCRTGSKERSDWQLCESMRIVLTQIYGDRKRYFCVWERELRGNIYE